LILRNAGPQGGPGMPEWGMLADPDQGWSRQGVRDHWCGCSEWR